MDEILDQLEGEIGRIEQRLRDLESAPLKEKLVGFFRLKQMYARLDLIRKRLYAITDTWDKIVIPKALEDSGMDKVSIPEVERTFYPLTKYSASMRDKEAGMEWLRENDGEDLIQPTVNAGTLASFLKDLVIETGKEPPEDIFKFNTYTITGMAKYTPKK